ncbi:hypothetical protein AB0B15_11695 [Streptomyces sp. NPDC045456]|uniref:hypothetical protein n=1 Tax=Streptomyces sp. NPDC045456 TaxID=3155254 RepID=UPI00340C154F
MIPGDDSGRAVGVDGADLVGDTGPASAAAFVGYRVHQEPVGKELSDHGEVSAEVGLVHVT